MANYNKQIKEILSIIEDLESRSQYSDFSDLNRDDVRKAITLLHSSLIRIAGKNSVYYKDFIELNDRKLFDGEKLVHMKGILQALLIDIENGFMDNYEKIIHGDIFTDYLEMSEYLLNEKYKDAAAVIAGSTLEEHLRQLCSKNDINIEIEKDDKIIRKKADLLNSELTKKEIYNKLDQKNITAWLDLRNKAAHGNYKDFTSEQVGNMITGIRDFITRNFYK